MQLVKEKTKHIHGRTRWTARVKEGNKEIFVYQWLPSPKELRRSRYPQKGRNGFVHPYLNVQMQQDEQYLQGCKEVSPSVYHVSLASGNRTGTTPVDMQERKLRVKIRDGFRCVQCGSKEELQVHHIKGMKSHRKRDLQTLCRKCHYEKHSFNKRE